MRAIAKSCAALVVILSPGMVSAQSEIAFFRLTNVQAFIELLRQKNASNNVATGIETGIDDLRSQIEIGVTTNSYIFHPKLLQINLAGSLLSSRQDIEREQISLATGEATQSNSSQEQILLNLATTLQLLKDKRYPTTFYYSRSNPVVRTGLEGSFTQTSDSYGVNFQLINVLPVSFNIKASRDESFGESLDRIVDFGSDRISVKTRKMFSSGDRIELDYERSSRRSRNGNPNRTILETLRHSQRTTLTANWRLGSRDQLQINQTASLNKRDNPDVTDIRFSPRLDWRHSPTLRSTFNYQFNQSERPDSMVKIRTETANAALRFTSKKGFGARVGANASRSTETDRLLQNSHGLSSSANYTNTSRVGQLHLSFAYNYDRNDQVSQVPQIGVIEEAIVLVGTVPVNLSRDFVIAGTVMVTNETGSQTLIEGVDYRLVEIGSRTQIERLIGGGILDGETVLVDYEVQTGGTFEYSQSGQMAGVDFKFAKYHNVFVRYRNNEQKLEAGFSTLPFNSVRSVEIGLRERLPLRWLGLQLDGELRYLHQDEDINPFEQKSVLVSLQAPLPYRLKLNISASRNIVDNLNSVEDSDMIVFSANLDWQTTRNLTVRGKVYYDEDTGGSILRNTTRGELRAQWRYRRILIQMSAKYENQQQGNIKGDSSELWLRIRRELF